MLHRLLDYFRCDLALDLGTATTLIGIPGEGLVVHEPSIVAVDRGTGRVLSGGRAVGQLAKKMQGRTPESISIVRPLANGVIADFELCEAMVGQLLRKVAPGTRWRKPRLLVAVPGGITKVEKRAVFNSLQRAGARQVWLIQEATAAAIGAGLPVAEPLASMVVDIGGGTTETAVLSLADTVASQSIRVAGDAMDQAIVNYLRRHYSLRIGLPAAEQLRISSGSAFALEEEHVEEISGLDAISGLPRKAMLTSEEIRQALADPLEAIVDAIKAVLDRVGPDLAADLIEHGLVLCGGGAQLRRLDRFLNEQTGLPVRLAADPVTTVLQGLLVCLEQFATWRPLLHSSDEDI